MFRFCTLFVCLLTLPQGHTSPRRYKPVIQVTEEININDITFTTSSPEYDRAKTVNYYNTIKPDGKYKGSFVSQGQKDGFVPVEKYTTGQPRHLPIVKYQPYKVYKPEKFRPVSYKPDKVKVLVFEPPSNFNEAPAQGVPFTGQSSKGTTRPTEFTEKFVSTPTFPPTILPQISTDKSQTFPQIDIQPFTQKQTDRPKPTQRPYYTQKPQKPERQYQPQPTASRDFPDKIETAAYKDSPQSESFLSEISTLHRGAGGSNNLEGVADLKTGERVEFQMYGMDGPQSYKFGFDTGKGHNRHFRFEERDNTGKVKGHYGYLDEDGKMRIMKYEADPITGFHAGPVEISPDEN